MVFFGNDLLSSRDGHPSFPLKMVFNERAVAVFPASLQHRDQKIGGLSYEDDSRGNALAAIITKSGIEVRRHLRFSTEAVVAILEQVLAHRDFSSFRDTAVRYGDAIVYAGDS